MNGLLELEWNVVLFIEVVEAFVQCDAELDRNRIITRQQVLKSFAARAVSAVWVDRRV